MFKTVGIIPARYKSSRFPGKPLVDLLGKPMIIWVAELSAKALGEENVYVATEDERIKNVVENSGYHAVMTSDQHPTGTDRLAEVATKVDADIYLNIQGDEPTVDPSILLKVANAKKEFPEGIINAMALISENEDPNNVNIPKVITTENNHLIYMSRLAIPGYKNPDNKPVKYYKQVCIYAFTKDQLLKYQAFGRKSYIENHEDIEILRFMEFGYPVKMIEVDVGTYAIDVKEDIPVVVNKLKEIHNIS